MLWHTNLLYVQHLQHMGQKGRRPVLEGQLFKPALKFD